MKKYKITDPEIILTEPQLKAIDFIVTRNKSLINYETGQGKTFICLESIFQLLHKGEIEKALIVCTKSSVLSFEDDLTKTNYPIENLVIIKSLDDLEYLEKKSKHIFVIQYEKLIDLRLIELVRAFKRFKSGLFIDEVHRVKTAGKFTKGGKSKESITAASLNRLKLSFEYLVGLTATTITSELEDGYRVISFISPGTLGGLRWFQQNFCVYQEKRRYLRKMRKYVSYPKLVGYKNLDKFLKYTKNVMIQYFPKLDYRFHVLSKSLKPGSKRAIRYDELAMSTHGAKNQKHSSVMPKLQRLVDKSAAKKYILKTIIKRCRKDGMIIYSRTRKGEMLEYIKDLCEDEGLKVKVISGSTKKEERRAIQRWSFEGETTDKVIIITDAAGQSMNLQFTHNLLFWEIPQGIGKFLQLKGRIGRMNSKWKHFDFYFLLIKNTIDEYWYSRFTCSKEMMKFTGSDTAIPTAKMNKFDDRKLKRERDKKVWRKDVNVSHFEESCQDSRVAKIGKRLESRRKDVTDWEC